MGSNNCISPIGLGPTTDAICADTYSSTHREHNSHTYIPLVAPALSEFVFSFLSFWNQTYFESFWGSALWCDPTRVRKD